MDESKWMAQVKRGLLELYILNLVNQEEMYGYQIVRRLTKVPGLVITMGTIYPLLSRLKREGLLGSSLVQSAQGPPRRMYKLTSEGKRHLRVINEAWREVADALEEFMPSKSSEK